MNSLIVKCSRVRVGHSLTSIRNNSVKSAAMTTATGKEKHKEPVSLAGSAAMISGIKLSNFKMQELISNSTIAIPLSLATANQKEITRHKIAHVISKFQKQEADTGSASVQIAVMTEKILCLARHFNVHRKDHASARGFQSLISRRKRMLAYLKRSNFEKFKETVTALGLRKEAIDIK